MESGEVMPEITIGYHTYGQLNEKKDNVIWICHALTANSNVTDWWSGLAGEGRVWDPNKHFIVCANILGSCYGSSGPLTVNVNTGRPYYNGFPRMTIRDLVKAHTVLREYLGIEHIEVLAGGSMGGYQAMEWAIIEPKIVNRLFLLATGASESAWGISIHTSQRIAIEADCTWQDASPHAGAMGMKAARAIGMLTYRNYQTFVNQQTDPDIQKTDHFRASSYIHHHGDKLVKRFNAQSYWLLSKVLDTHNIARGRSDSIEEVLGSIKQRSLIIGITSDILCPVEEQRFLARNMPDAAYYEIDSLYGHDGFLKEFERIGKIYLDWMKKV